MVYTRTGDNGTTSLVGGKRVKKYDTRVEAYGTVDELNSHIGLLAEMLAVKKDDSDSDARKQFEAIFSQLKRIQNNLFVLQTLLATEDEETYKRLPQMKEETVSEMESWIDDMDYKLSKLASFVIPGGSIESAQAHVARTVCRRGEREIVKLSEKEKIDSLLIKYINRTSDYLFVLSRYILFIEKKKEIFWSAE
ncbi:MAG: cob(I)yrinic acid a,c-diamide adenosyltransferase [Bacteroidales bacterium]|nr:cob(I)yrinic acid a,c-diamide adenosyltransferase [Bacteroidales bacterium]